MSIIKYIVLSISFYLLIIYGLKDLRYLIGFSALRTISTILSYIITTLAYIVILLENKNNKK